MMNSAQVTVLIPLYNKAGEVERAVRGVLAQSEPNFSLVVIDDGSTDGSADVVARIDDPRIRTVGQTNLGASAARNRGLDEARTELVAFLDADDEWRPDFLTTVLALRTRHPEAGLWATGYERVFDHGLRAELPALIRVPQSPEGGLIDDFFVSMEKDCPVCSSNILGSRGVFRETGGFPDKVELGEDWDTWIRIALKYPIAFSPGVQVRYHQDSSDRAMNRRRHSGEDTAMARTLRRALADGAIGPAPRASVASLFSQHLLFLARLRIMAGDGVRARKLIAEARSHCNCKAHWRRMWVESYLGPGVNTVLDAFRRFERSFRRRRRTRNSNAGYARNPRGQKSEVRGQELIRRLDQGP
ncbi:MAG: glycosyltransferase [Lentisphaerales bacterium]|nr:MAG: glycosyltransferase [Lentisphaerales bacterium]